MKLLVVTENYFPYGSAMASRILAFSKIFNELNYDYHIIALHGENPELLKEDISFEIVNKNEKTSLETYLGNREFVNRVKQYIESNKPDYVFMISVHMHFNEINKMCKKYNIKTIYELCEWYDPSSYNFKELDIRYLRFNKNIKTKYQDVDGMVLISRLLYEYFDSKNKNICRMPSICDVKNKKYSYDINNERIRIVFTGSTSKSKELIKPILEALASNKEYNKRISFDIYGINRNQLLNAVDNDAKLLDSLSGCVTANGFVQQNKIEDILTNANYQIFIRPNRRSSNAGFPTKLCESFSAATPVITNDTGDISLYLKDGYNGFICKGNSKEDIALVFDKIISLDKENYKELRKNARETALNSFDYRNYKDIIKDLFR